MSMAGSCPCEADDLEDRRQMTEVANAMRSMHGSKVELWTGKAMSEEKESPLLAKLFQLLITRDSINLCGGLLLTLLLYPTMFWFHQRTIDMSLMLRRNEIEKKPR